MKASVMQQYGTLYLDGYYTGSTQGGGTFTWLTAAQAAGLTPDGGIVIAPSDHAGTCADGCLMRKLDGYISLYYFGAKADYDVTTGTGTDNSAAITAAIKGSVTFGLPLFVPSTAPNDVVSAFYFTLPQTAPENFPGMYGAGLENSLLAYGGSAGTTAFTFSSNGQEGFQYHDFSVFSAGANSVPGNVGSGRSIKRNGISWGDGTVEASMNVDTVGAWNFNGFGQKFDFYGDARARNIWVISSGNDDSGQFAWIVTDGNAGTSVASNHCVFEYVKVELSYDQAEYVSPDTYLCTIINNHSERTQRISSTTQYTHILQGNNTTFINGRIEGTTLGLENVLMGSVAGEYLGYRLASGASITLQWSGNVDGLGCTVQDLYATGTVNVVDQNPLGWLLVNPSLSGGSANLKVSLPAIPGQEFYNSVKIVGGHIDLLDVGSDTGNPSRVEADGTDIGALANDIGGRTTLYMTGGSLDLTGTVPSGINITATGTTFPNAWTTGGNLYTLRNVMLNGLLTVGAATTGVPILDMDDSYVNAGLSASGNSWRLGPGNRYSGTIQSAFGSAPGSVGPRGFTTYNALPTTGQPSYWVSDGSAWHAGPNL